MTMTNATIAEVIAEISARLDALEAAIEELTGKKIEHEAEGKAEDAQEESQRIMDALECAAAARGAWQCSASNPITERLEAHERKSWFERALAELRQILAPLKEKLGLMAAWCKLIDAAELVAQCNPKLESQVWETVEATRV